MQKFSISVSATPLRVMHSVGASKIITFTINYTFSYQESQGNTLKEGENGSQPLFEQKH